MFNKPLQEYKKKSLEEHVPTKTHTRCSCGLVSDLQRGQVKVTYCESWLEFERFCPKWVNVTTINVSNGHVFGNKLSGFAELAVTQHQMKWIFPSALCTQGASRWNWQLTDANNINCSIIVSYSFEPFIHSFNFSKLMAGGILLYLFYLEDSSLITLYRHDIIT